MMQERKRTDFWSKAALYLLAFVGFAMSYLFTYPQYDVPIFCRDFSGDFISVVKEAVFYGNGRFLGNVLGFYFAHHFAASSFVTAFFLAVIVWLSNLLFFDNKKETIFPLAILVAFPAVGILQGVYSMIASFCNYAVPLVFVLLSSLMIKKVYHGGGNLCFVVLAFSSCAACLFSENTTVVIFCASVLLCVTELVKFKKLLPQSVVNLTAVVFGTLIMLLIPKLSQTSGKLDDYRGFVLEPTALLKNAVYALRSFSLLANQYVLIYIIISAIMLFLLFNHCKVGKFMKSATSIILVLFPVSCVLPVCFSAFAYKFASFYIAAEVIYLVAVLLVAIWSKDKKVLFSTLATVVLLGSAVAPMMIVNHRGDRTFFTTFAILLIYALVLFKKFGSKMLTKKKICTAFKVATPTVFAAICVVMLVFGAQNFNCYSFRAEYIARQRTTSSHIAAPYLAHERLTMEASLGQIDPCIYGANLPTTFEVVDCNEWEYSGEYKSIINADPFESVSEAFTNYKFKDPIYPETLYREYLAEIQ